MTPAQLMKMRAGRERQLRTQREQDEAAVLTYREWSRAEALAWSRYQHEDDPLTRLALRKVWHELMSAMPTAPPDSCSAWGSVAIA